MQVLGRGGGVDIDDGRGGVVDHREFAPPEGVQDMIAHRDAVGLGCDHGPDCSTFERLVDLERWNVGLGVVHAAAHVGVHGHDLVLHENLAGLQGGQRGRFETEVLVRGRSVRARGQDDLSSFGRCLGGCHENSPVVMLEMVRFG